MTPKMNIIILMYVHENDTNLHIFGDFLKNIFPQTSYVSPNPLDFEI